MEQLAKIFTGDLILDSAVVAAVIKVVWSLLSAVYDWLSSLLMIHLDSLKIYLQGMDAELADVVDFKCLVVRYGDDAYIRNMASDREKQEGRLQNKIVDVSLGKDDEAGYFLKLDLPVHNRIGVQFKCFVDVLDKGMTAKVETLLNSSENISAVSASTSVERDRIYFLVDDETVNFEIMDTIDGKQNNFVYPV